MIWRQLIVLTVAVSVLAALSTSAGAAFENPVVDDQVTQVADDVGVAPADVFTETITDTNTNANAASGGRATGGNANATGGNSTNVNTNTVSPVITVDNQPTIDLGQVLPPEVLALLNSLSKQSPSFVLTPGVVATVQAVVPGK